MSGLSTGVGGVGMVRTRRDRSNEGEEAGEEGGCNDTLLDLSILWASLGFP